MAQQSKIVAEYPYHNESGDLIAVKLRWEPGFDGIRKKDFTWRRPLPEPLRAELKVPQDAFAWANGLSEGTYWPTVLRDGTWKFEEKETPGQTGVKIPGAVPSLFGLPLLIKLAARPEMPVFVVEGEGKVNLLLKLGFAAVAGMAGKSKWLTAWGQHFKGLRVVVLPDRDIPGDGGLGWGYQVAASAIANKCRSVRVVLLPLEHMPKGGDVVNWLGCVEPKTAKTCLVELVKQFPEYTAIGVAK